MRSDISVQQPDSKSTNTILAPEGSEKFSWRLFAIVMGMHAVALPALLHFNKYYVLAWIGTHLFFATVGVAMGLHRLLSHRSFTPSAPAFYFITAVATLCFQGGPIFWAIVHRNHHRFTEAYGDPHSANRGFFWCHIGWMFHSNPNGFSYAKSLRLAADWRKNKFAMWLEVNSTKFNVGFLAALFVTCYAFHQPWLFFWIGPLRIISVWHATWMINSWAHNAHRPENLRRPVRSILLTLVLGGEGNHEFHHRHPSSVCHSQSRFNLDYSYMVLRGLRVFRIVNFRTPQFFRGHGPDALRPQLGASPSQKVG